MAVLQMQKFSICALKKDRHKIIAYLQTFGDLQLNEKLEPDETFTRLDTSAQHSKYEKNVASAEAALDILQKYAPEKSGLLSSFDGKAPIEEATMSEIVSQKSENLKMINRIIKLNKQIAEDNGEIQKLNAQIDGLTPWMNLDIPINTTHTSKTAVIIGSLPALYSLDELYGMLAEADTPVDITIISADKNATCIVAICMKSEESRVEDIFRSKGFARPASLGKFSPRELREKLLSEIETRKKDIEDLTAQIVSFSINREKIRVISDYYRLCSGRYEAAGQMLQSKSTFICEGYIPAKDVNRIKGILEKDFVLDFETYDVPEDEAPPVLLKNNKYSESFEGVISAYALPAKGEIDPTLFVSIFYFVLFGIMLSDAAYGIIVFLACIIVVAKHPNMDPGMKRMLNMFKWCGLSTIIWGVLFGGFFGDMVKVVTSTYFNTTLEFKPVWFAPLDDPMRMLIVSLIFGIVHMFLGLGIKLYMNIRDKQYQPAISIIALYMLLVGLILLLIPTELFGSILGTMIVFPTVVNKLALYMTIIGLVGLVLFGASDQKNPVMRLLLGLYEVYNLTGWLSDILSYSRLLALGLATGVIAQVFNQMASMVGTVAGPVGVILFIVIFLVGHIFNLCINMLGAYVHTNRLQYVEFFGKFYEGGGLPFTPFKSNTKYVNLKTKED